jgi:hypothetical protein
MEVILFALIQYVCVAPEPTPSFKRRGISKHFHTPANTMNAIR